MKRLDKSDIKINYSLISQKDEMQQQLFQPRKIPKECMSQEFPVKAKKKKCFLCDQSSQVMQKCSLLSKFREHEIYCKEMSIHVWKSWKRMSLD